MNQQVASLALGLGLLAGCGDGGDAPATDPPSAELLVSAAASLTDAFTEIAGAFEIAHAGVEVRLNLAGSSTLRAQILEGAPVDVFASANREIMEQVADAGGVADDPRVFALNDMVIAVPAGNPAGVRGLADFARDELLLGLCAEAVPCGGFAREVLQRAGVAPALDTAEPDVRALLTKVELGELDAAIVYRTDVTASGAVDRVAIPADANVVAQYPIAVLAGAPRPEVARAFVAFVLSAEGRAILVRHGFRTP